MPTADIYVQTMSLASEDASIGAAAYRTAVADAVKSFNNARLYLIDGTKLYALSDTGPDELHLSASGSTVYAQKIGLR